MLPAIPMRKRLFDPRVGYFASEYSVYTETSQKDKDKHIHQSLATGAQRRRPGPVEEEVSLSSQRNPLLYYIDPATPKQWRSLSDRGDQRLANRV